MPDPRSKQACEPCRKKKSKCTAERPACSFCKRLNQPCVYRSPEPPKSAVRKSNREAKSAKTNDLQDRFQMLESQVNGIYQLLHSSSVPTILPQSRPNSGFGGNNMLAQPQRFVPRENFNISNPDPPSEVLDQLVEVYRTKLHLQPLQLFKLVGLRDYILASPQFLRWSFLALVLHFGSHEFYSGREEEAVEFYSTASRQDVTSLAMQGLPKLQVLQALSLLVLVDVVGKHDPFLKRPSPLRHPLYKFKAVDVEASACKPGQAWMSIGTLSRLESLRRVLQSGSVDSSEEQELNLKCHWTVLILEQTFTPQQCTASLQVDETLDYPASAPIPPSLPPTSGGECPVDLYSEDAVEDLGITTYYIKLVRIWGDLSSYMHQVRIGKAGTAWAVGSLHNNLCAQIFEHEAVMAHRHLLRNVRFTERSSAELHEQREYWVPWVLMQVASHAVPAILNHPFVHLVAMRDRPKGQQSRLFLQQTVDQALYHSAWVIRLLRSCEAQDFEVYDPLVGQLVAVLATIPWLFQRASDFKVAQKARDDLSWCKGFLARFSKLWPHISQKLKLLEDLDSVAENNAQPPSHKGISIVFHPALFWALVDPTISQMTPPTPPQDGSGRLQDATIRVSTHYIHPVLENEVEAPIGDQNSDNGPFFLSDETLEQVYLDNIFTQLLPDMDGLQ